MYCCSCWGAVEENSKLAAEGASKAAADMAKQSCRNEGGREGEKVQGYVLENAVEENWKGKGVAKVNPPGCATRHYRHSG
jgi:hypothetical protein